MRVPSGEHVTQVTQPSCPPPSSPCAAPLVARAGSDTVYFGTDEYLLDAAAQATLAAPHQPIAERQAIESQEIEHPRNGGHFVRRRRELPVRIVLDLIDLDAKACGHLPDRGAPGDAKHTRLVEHR